MASHNFLILSAKFMSVLNPICNRLAAELNEISVSQVTLRRPGDKERRSDSNDPSKDEILTTFEIGVFHL